MKLYYAPNTISVAVAIALAETGTAYEAIRVDFAAAEQTQPAYLNLNPKGRVPALVTGHDILTETGAILRFVAPGLIPEDPLKAARMYEVMFYLASTMHVNHAHKMRGHRWADQQSSLDDMTAKVPQTMAASCAYLEEALAFSPFAVGDELTLADPYLATVLSWLAGDKVDITAFPRLTFYQSMMESRPSLKHVRAQGMLT